MVDRARAARRCSSTRSITCSRCCRRASCRNEDQGYAFAAIIMPRGGEPRPHAGGRRARSTRSSRRSRASRRARWSPATACSTAASRPTPRTFFVTLQATSRSATRSIDDREEARTRAPILHDVLRARRSTIERRDRASRSRRRRSPASAPPAASSSGSRTPAPAIRSQLDERDAGVPQEGARAARARPASRTTFRASTQQLRADVDRDKATLLGVPIQDVYSAIQAQFGSLTVSQYNQFSRRVVGDRAVGRAVPAEPGGPDAPVHAQQPDDQMVPLSALVTTQWSPGPDLLPHFNGFPAAKINGNAAPGYSSGDAIAAMEAIAQRGAAAGLHVRVVGPRVRGEEVRRHVGDRVRVRLHHRVPRAGRAVRVVDAAGRGDDGGAVRHPRRARSPTSCAASTTTCTSRSACWC